MITIIADGGHKPGKSHGSYLLLSESLSTIQRSEFDLPRATTNNEAKYGSLLRALKAALNLGVLKIRVIMDSEVVLNQAWGEWNCKAKNLKPLCEEAINLLGEFETVVLEHVDREVIVEFLGH